MNMEWNLFKQAMLLPLHDSKLILIGMRAQRETWKRTLLKIYLSKWGIYKYNYKTQQN